MAIEIKLNGERVVLQCTHAELEDCVYSSNINIHVKHEICSLIEWHKEQTQGLNDNQIIGQSTII